MNNRIYSDETNVMFKSIEVPIPYRQVLNSAIELLRLRVYTTNVRAVLKMYTSV